MNCPRWICEPVSSRSAVVKLPLIRFLIQSGSAPMAPASATTPTTVATLPRADIAGRADGVGRCVSCARVLQPHVCGWQREGTLTVFSCPVSCTHNASRDRESSAAIYKYRCDGKALTLVLQTATRSKTKELAMVRGETRAENPNSKRRRNILTLPERCPCYTKLHARTRGWSLDDVPPIAAEQFER